ncbi:hypothetical protein [Edaphosphingomonas haloaromaticamans]|uniref:hypothetical protein n=1 Tax=Edaphosphingomonas haloaromaticamans TaxID=653954 RepID=UPI00174D22FD|nr:hypothetical protein [Sphingomonas haloaromaticamans]
MKDRDAPIDDIGRCPAPAGSDARASGQNFRRASMKMLDLGPNRRNIFSSN